MTRRRKKERELKKKMMTMIRKSLLKKLNSEYLIMYVALIHISNSLNSES